MSVDHYENFPVASLLLPKAMRRPIEIIYHFARSADDIADEGNAPPEERLKGLQAYQHALDQIEAGEEPDEPLFQQLRTIITQHQLPIQLLRDLLDAFAQDVVKTRYADYPELLDYCRRSANPVGRLVLHLFDRTEAEHLYQSDCICSALQLINFWQDVAVDWKKQRIYLPQDELNCFNIKEADIATGTLSQNWEDLMAFQVQRTRQLMLAGAPLVKHLPGRLGWEIRFTIQGGLRILKHIESTRYDVFNKRPELRLPDWFAIAHHSLTM